MELTKLRHIVAIADTGSFSRAAESENITQPALSRSIAAFEARHGVRLFDRGRGGVMPTAVGELVIEQARALICSAEELEHNLTLYGRGAAGRVAFGLGPLMASLLLPRLGPELLRSSPNLHVVSVVKPPDQLVAELFNGTIEMLIGNNWLVREAPGLISEPIGAVDLAVVARSGHPLAGRPNLASADLEAFPTARPVRFDSDVVPVGGAFICDNFHILRETVLATDCVWITSAAFVAEELRDKRLVRLDVEEFDSAKNQVAVISRPGRTRSPAAVSVVQLARKMLGEMDNPQCGPPQDRRGLPSSESG